GFVEVSDGGSHLRLAPGGSDLGVRTDYEHFGSRVSYGGTIYGDIACVSLFVLGIVWYQTTGHNVCDVITLVDICYRSGISSGKEVDIGLGGGSDKSLHCKDDFELPGRATCLNDLAAKLNTPSNLRGLKCADIGYGFLPFSFSSFGELEKDAVTLLKRIRKFSMTQDIGTRAAVHIFNRISFSIAKGVGAQIVSRLPDLYDMLKHKTMTHAK
ncbi:hypothetical protein Tco_1052564, partial [Tanacetum coccineum]